MFSFHYASKARFYTHELGCVLLFLVLFISKCNFFVFFLKHFFFENVKKKKKKKKQVYGRGGLERVGRITVNTTSFFFGHI